MKNRGFFSEFRENIRLNVFLIVFGILMLYIFNQIGYTSTCSSISRSNYTTNQVLTSSQLNTDFNTAYTQINDIISGGCTLEKDILDPTSFDVPLNAIKSGCRMSVDSGYDYGISTNENLVISPCRISVNGNWVYSTATQSLTWGCAGCSSEATDSEFYVYAKNDSDGSTLNLLILSEGPNTLGEDSSGNKIIGSFINDYSGYIRSSSVKNWKVNELENEDSYSVAYSSVIGSTAKTDSYKYIDVSAKISSNGSFTSYTDTVGEWISSVSGGSPYLVTFYADIWSQSPLCNVTTIGETAVIAGMYNISTASLRVNLLNTSAVATSSDFIINCKGIN